MGCSTGGTTDGTGDSRNKVGLSAPANYCTVVTGSKPVPWNFPRPVPLSVNTQFCHVRTGQGGPDYQSNNVSSAIGSADNGSSSSYQYQTVYQAGMEPPDPQAERLTLQSWSPPYYFFDSGLDGNYCFEYTSSDISEKIGQAYLAS